MELKNTDCLEKNKHIFKMLQNAYNNDTRIFWIEGEYGSGKTLFTDIMANVFFKANKVKLPAIQTLKDLDNILEKMKFHMLVKSVYIVDNFYIDLYKKKDNHGHIINIEQEEREEIIKKFNYTMEKLWKYNIPIIFTSFTRHHKILSPFQKYFFTVRLEYKNKYQTFNMKEDIYLKPITCMEYIFKGSYYGKKIKKQKIENGEIIIDHLRYNYIHDAFEKLFDAQDIYLKNNNMEALANYYDNISKVDIMRDFRDDMNTKHLHIIRNDIVIRSINQIKPQIEMPNSWYIKY